MSIANELVGLSDRFMCWQTCFIPSNTFPVMGGRMSLRAKAFAFIA